jgi:hypothetical protein
MRNMYCELSTIDCPSRRLVFASSRFGVMYRTMEVFAPASTSSARQNRRQQDCPSRSAKTFHAKMEKTCRPTNFVKPISRRDKASPLVKRPPKGTVVTAAPHTFVAGSRQSCTCNPSCLAAAIARPRGSDINDDNHNNNKVVVGRKRRDPPRHQTSHGFGCWLISMRKGLASFIMAPIGMRFWWCYRFYCCFWSWHGSCTRSRRRCWVMMASILASRRGRWNVW